MCYECPGILLFLLDKKNSKHIYPITSQYGKGRI